MLLVPWCSLRCQCAHADATTPIPFSHSNTLPALHDAAGFGHIQVCRKLLAAGADLHTKDELDWTALDFAHENGHSQVAALLQEHPGQKVAGFLGTQAAAAGKKNRSAGR